MLSKLLTIGVLIACSALGVRMTMFLGFHNGLMGVIGNALSSPALQTPTSSTTTVSAIPFPAGPQPFVISYTGLGPIDRLLGDLIAYFTLLMHTPQNWPARAAWTYIMFQFYGIWQAVQLEGYRLGNANRTIRHTAILGVIFQVASLTFTLPIYLIIHILTDPSVTVPGSLRVPRADRVAAPLAGFLSFTLPAMGMGLPGFLKTPTYHYVSALWQVFPVTQTVWHRLCRQIFRLEGADSGVNTVPMHVEEIEVSEQFEATGEAIKVEKEIITATSSNITTKTPASPTHFSMSQGLPTAYSDAFFQGIVSHVTLLTLVLLPPGTPGLPPVLRHLATQFTFSTVFTPFTFRTSPVIESSMLENYAAGASTQGPLLGALALSFLQWDLFFSSVAYLTWVVYDSSKASKENKKNPGFLRILCEVLVWTLLGGPAAAGAVMLSKRDKGHLALA
ncbi:hypothetical protein CFO_g4938 [Ceratocystis platani]|uniref:Uncharacterized protein n=1 Tax=Ceratocystis fimbriata f. sp. platani TaxID=88771 RepID=A0A0F8B058_CERFI|nr:hypothetical protein CFO_g4938 [Ceratocystis platani]